MSSTSLWMGDVGAHWDEAYVASFFAPFPGFTRVKLMTRSGYGFVDFDSTESAAAALAAMQGRSTGEYGTTFRLNWAGKGKGADALGLSIRPSADFSVFVAGLPPEHTEEDLRSLFASRYASVVSVRIVHDTSSGASKGYGFVRFGDPDDQVRAVLEMNGIVVSGSRLRVSEAQSAAMRGPGGMSPASPFGTPAPPGMPGYPGYASGPAPPAGYPGGYPGPGVPIPAPTTVSPFPPANPLSMTGIPAGLRPTFGPPPLPSEGQTTVFVGGLDPTITEYELYRTFSTVGPVSNVKIPKDKSCGFVQYSYRVHAEQALLSLQGLQLGSQHIRLAWGKNQLGSRSPIAVMPATHPHYLVPPRAPMFAPAPRGVPSRGHGMEMDGAGFPIVAHGGPYAGPHAAFGGRPRPATHLPGDARDSQAVQMPVDGVKGATPDGLTGTLHKAPSGGRLDYMQSDGGMRAGPGYHAVTMDHLSGGLVGGPAGHRVPAEFVPPTDTLFASMAGLKIGGRGPEFDRSAATLESSDGASLFSAASSLSMGTGLDSIVGTSVVFTGRSAATARSDATMDPLNVPDASAYNAHWGVFHAPVSVPPSHAVPRFAALGNAPYGTAMGAYVGSVAPAASSAM